jgi:hypothetical protein
MILLIQRIAKPVAHFTKDAQSRADKSPGPNAFVPASIHNIIWSVKNRMNDISSKTAKRRLIAAFQYVSFF